MVRLDFIAVHRSTSADAGLYMEIQLGAHCNIQCKNKGIFKKNINLQTLDKVENSALLI